MQTTASDTHLKIQDDDYTSTGPGTLAGRYLRSFWNPIYHSVDLKPLRPVPLRVMGELYTLYRTESGEVFLTEGRCPHRGTQLSSGWVEGTALRCFYHGWKFESDGRCSEQPAEESRFVSKVNLRTWPVKEYLGLIFAYLGEGTAPIFPRHPEFESFDGLLEIDSYVRYCNYFQNVENALDMSHVAFTHSDNMASFGTIGLGRNLSAEESDWGVSYRFRRDDGELRVQQFGMPNVFYMTALPTDADVGWQESLFWWVPIDDESHMQFSLHRVPATGPVAERICADREARRETIDISHHVACDLILSGRKRIGDFDKTRVDLVRLQDDIAQLGQGIFADRSAEQLGRADIGVVAIRRLWRRELTHFAQGLPLKNWERNPQIRPRAWHLPDTLVRMDGDSQPPAENAEPRLLDMRPHIEVDAQLEALHFAPRREATHER